MVAVDVRAEVAAPANRDVTANAVTIAFRVDLAGGAVLRYSGAEHAVEAIRLFVEKSDVEVLEVQQVARAAKDFLFEKGKAFLRVEARELLDIQAEQFAPGAINRVDLILEPARAGDIPDHGCDLGDALIRVDYGSGGYLKTLVALRSEAEAPAVNLYRAGLRFLLCPSQGFDAAPAYPLPNLFGEPQHDGIGPIEFTGLSNYADTLAHAVDYRGSLAGRVDAL